MDTDTQNMKVDDQQGVGVCGALFSRAQNRLARKLHSFAETVSRSAEVSRNSDPRTDELSRLGTQTSAWIHGAADRIEDLDPETIKKDFSAKVQRNPGSSLLVAAAAGLLLGIVVRRR